MDANEGHRPERCRRAGLVCMVLGALLLPPTGARAQITPYVSGGGPGDEIPPPSQDWMEISLGWTSFRGHRNGLIGVVDLELEGSISSSLPAVWVLSVREPAPDLLANLQLVESVDGRAVPPGTEDVPLSWRISIDAGPFALLEQVDGAMRLTLPGGRHSIVLRISGELRPGQKPGYYRLVLDQCVVPLL